MPLYINEEIIVRIFVSLHKISLEYSEGLNNDEHPKQALIDVIFVCDHVTFKLGLLGLSGLSGLSDWHSMT